MSCQASTRRAATGRSSSAPVRSASRSARVKIDMAASAGAFALTDAMPSGRDRITSSRSRFALRSRFSDACGSAAITARSSRLRRLPAERSSAIGRIRSWTASRRDGLSGAVRSAINHARPRSIRPAANAFTVAGKPSQSSWALRTREPAVIGEICNAAATSAAASDAARSCTSVSTVSRSISPSGRRP